MTSLSTNLPARTHLDLLTSSMREGSRGLWISAVVMSGLAALFLGLQFIDPRMVGDANTWHKPAKFFFSIAVHFATVAWAVSLLPASETSRRVLRGALLLLLASGWSELGYIVFRAARAEASHFNHSSTFADVAYALMGLGAVSMTAVSFYLGWRLWKHRRYGLLTEAAAIGLMLGAVLGTLAGGYMSAQSGHGVGVVPGSESVGFFGWSMTGGDLRIAHFAGLHAMQIVPMASLSQRRGTVYAVAAFITIITVAAFLQAVAGMPLLRS